MCGPTRRVADPPGSMQHSHTPCPMRARRPCPPRRLACSLIRLHSRVRSKVKHKILRPWRDERGPLTNIPCRLLYPLPPGLISSVPARRVARRDATTGAKALTGCAHEPTARQVRGEDGNHGVDRVWQHQHAQPRRAAHGQGRRLSPRRAAGPCASHSRRGGCATSRGPGTGGTAKAMLADAQGAMVQFLWGDLKDRLG